MSVERERVRAFVKEELVRRLGRSEASSLSAASAHPALVEIRIEVDSFEPSELSKSRPCIIEPDRPCYNSGYCRRLGY
jgi:hypothetical protein